MRASKLNLRVILGKRFVIIKFKKYIKTMDQLTQEIQHISPSFKVHIKIFKMLNALSTHKISSPVRMEIHSYDL